MKKHPWIVLVLAILVLTVPTILYLIWLVPQLSAEYTSLLASAGIIGGAGTYGANAIPDEVKYGTLFKTASKAYTMLIVLTIVEKFLNKLILLGAILILSYIIFKILIDIWHTLRRRKENGQLATEIARNLNKVTE